MTGFVRVCLLLLLSANLLTSSTFAQSEVFDDPDGKYTLNLPNGWLGVVNTDSLGKNEVNIVYKVRENGSLKIRVAELPSGQELMDFANNDVTDRVRYMPNYTKITMEKFLLGGPRVGAFLAYDFKNAAAQPFSGFVYWVPMDKKTIYVLQFTGRRNTLASLRSQTDLIARSLRLKD